jgi:Transposase DDE domain group 1
VNGNSTRRVKVEGGGEQVVAHVGLHALGQMADELGLGDALSAAIPWTGERAPVHARGKVLTQMMLVLAGGGECCADIEDLRPEPRLFGWVPSDSTVWRAMHEPDAGVLAAVRSAVAGVRSRVWDNAGLVDSGERIVLDIDASLVEIHSENKTGTAPTYKGGFGFHPMFCFADRTGETLAALLRPGNAGANDAADHLEVLDTAIAQLPEPVAVGHRRDDDPALARRAVMVRTDSAGATRGFVDGCRARNIGFAVVARKTEQIHAAIAQIVVDDQRWAPATCQDGTARKGAAAAEVTDLVDLSRWPEGTRLIVRREPLHPGAQQTLFPCAMFRYWGHYTDQAGDPVVLDTHMRAHAHVEDNIKALKESGLERFPFSDLDANRTWLATMAMAADLVAWFQLLCLDGPLAKAEPKALRWRLWHAPARVVSKAGRDIVRILEGWRDTDTLLDAYRRINAIT